MTAPYRLVREQLVKKPRHEVFTFFERPENLAAITPASVGFRIMTPSPISMAAGAVIDYTIKVFGLRVRWTSLISDYNPPYKFIDVQLRGPYSFWHHTHYFEETAEGTMLRDEVSYILPLGPLGRLMHGLVVKRQLKKIFDYRARAIADHFGQS